MKMKKIIILLIVTCFAINSCNNLDLVPLDKLPSNSYYKTAEEFDGAMFAAYSTIQDFWGTSTETLGEFGEYWKITVTVTDDMQASPNSDGESKNADNLNINAGDKPFGAIYTQLYEGIYRCNTVLEHLELENELTPAQKTLFEGEAKFLRAFFHFEAMKLFGTPPMVLATPKSLTDMTTYTNATSAELFTQILADFNTAFSNLPLAWDSGNTGRATKWAAKAYIGKVNVWKDDMPAAVTAFADVIANGPFSLIDTDNPTQDLEDVFALDNENNQESIFEIQFGGPHSDDNIWVFDDTHSESFKASQGSGRSWFWDAGGFTETENDGGKLGFWDPTQNLVDAFEPGDARLSSFIYQDGDDYFVWSGGLVQKPYDPNWSSSGYTVKKYGGQRNVVDGAFSGNNQGNFNNERMYRFAEMKLLYAEALFETGNLAGALTQVNDIRDRAGLAALVGPVTIDDIMQEKRIELCFEPHRWFDITRWDAKYGIGDNLFPSDWNDKFQVYPFPQSEIDRTKGFAVKINQNTGY
jgi:starch-binding outer membrane protein, SusD/RagB family